MGERERDGEMEEDRLSSCFSLFVRPRLIRISEVPPGSGEDPAGFPAREPKHKREVDASIAGMFVQHVKVEVLA